MSNGKKKNIVLIILGTIMAIIFSLIIICVALLFADYKYEESKISWNTGKVEILDKTIVLPCEVSKFEKVFDVTIDKDKISENNFYTLSLDEQETQIYSNTLYKKEIKLYIEEDIITGIQVDISNLWNDKLDRRLGEAIVFPNNVTANSSLEEIKEKYDTGLLNFFKRDWSENIEISGDYSYGIKYSDDDYTIDIKSLNNKVQSIFYYYNE